MTYEGLKVLNFGEPSIELLNEFIREQEAISIFYQEQLKRDKKPYWKGLMGKVAKWKKEAIKKGIMIYGDDFHENEMGLTETEKLQCIEENKKLLL